MLNLLDPHGTYFGCKSGTQSGCSLSLCCTLPSHLQTVGLGLGCGVGVWVCGVGGFRGLGCVALGCGWVGVWRVGVFALGWNRNPFHLGFTFSPSTHMGGLGWVGGFRGLGCVALGWGWVGGCTGGFSFGGPGGGGRPPKPPRCGPPTWCRSPRGLQVGFSRAPKSHLPGYAPKGGGGGGGDPPNPPVAAHQRGVPPPLAYR